MRTLKLYFEDGQLIETLFRENPTSPERRSIRGKSGGAYRQAGSFQWSSAVRALALLAVKALSTPEHPFIQGEGGSLAASLDYALSKQPEWLTDLFGCDREGISYARRCILRTNPERKRPGPVVLAFNLVYLPISAIQVYVSGQLATPEELILLENSLSNGSAYIPQRAMVTYEEPHRIAS